MKDNLENVVELLKDVIQINAIIGTELIQLVENSSASIHGQVPLVCKEQHFALKEEIVEIAEKWNQKKSMLKEHNLKHL